MVLCILLSKTEEFSLFTSLMSWKYHCSPLRKLSSNLLILSEKWMATSCILITLHPLIFPKFMRCSQAFFNSLIPLGTVQLMGLHTRKDPLISFLMFHLLTSKSLVLWLTSNCRIEGMGMEPCILTGCASILHTSFSQFNSCLGKGYFPRQWKECLLFSLHKNEKNNFENYWWVAIPVITVFEVLLVK